MRPKSSTLTGNELELMKIVWSHDTGVTVRDVYEELHRPTTDPACPIATRRDAFAPADRVGVEDSAGGSWSHWVVTFSRTDGEPGGSEEPWRLLSVGHVPLLGACPASRLLRVDPAAPGPAGLRRRAERLLPGAAPRPPTSGSFCARRRSRPCWGGGGDPAAAVNHPEDRRSAGLDRGGRCCSCCDGLGQADHRDATSTLPPLASHPLPLRRLLLPAGGHRAGGPLVSRFAISYRNVEELFAERAIEVHHTTICCWAQRFTPLLAEAARPC